MSRSPIHPAAREFRRRQGRFNPLTAILPVLLAVATESVAADALATGSAPPSAGASKLAITRIGFGSCARQTGPQMIWDAIASWKPEVMVLLGDTVYADTQDMDVMRGIYAQLEAQPGFQGLRASTRLLATWDDHDYGQNDAGAAYPRRDESKRVFLDFIGDPPDSPRRHRDGVYDSYFFGPVGRRVQVILLDTRSFRSPLETGTSIPYPGAEPSKRYVANVAEDATMLGDGQWSWLESELRKPAEVRLIGSSIQVLAEDHPYEKWMNFPRERERLLRVLSETKATGVLILSGDRHDAELSLLPAAGRTDPLTGESTPNPARYPLWDLTASSFNTPRPWSWDVNRHRVGDVYWGANFGTVEIEWERSDPLVTIGIRDDKGEPAFAHRIPLSTLHAPAR